MKKGYLTRYMKRTGCMALAIATTITMAGASLCFGLPTEAATQEAIYYAAYTSDQSDILTGTPATAAALTNDKYSKEQWALRNDGTFEMEDKGNDFYVYDLPFETPSAPGKWSMPDAFMNPGGFYRFFFKSTGEAIQKTDTTTATKSSGTTTATKSTDEAIQKTDSTASDSAKSAVAGIDINVQEGWTAYAAKVEKRDAIIALIDTGVDYSHEDLAGHIWTNPGEIAGNGKDDDGNGYIDDVYGWNFYNNSNRVYTSASADSHGTHGAGTMVASANNGLGIAGIAGNEHVKVMIIKALGGISGSGSTTDLVRAIKYAEANGASICNLSLSSSVNDTTLYKAMAESNMLFVCAAGNDSASIENGGSYPAAYNLDNIISVANLNYNGMLAASSNYGAVSVDLAAPGSYILSTTPGNGYSYMTGTSMAAPMVSAVAAMVYSAYPDATLADVKDIVLGTAAKLTSLSGSVATGGMLDMGAALTYDATGMIHRNFDKSNVVTQQPQNQTQPKNPGSQPAQPKNPGSQPAQPQQPGSGLYQQPDWSSYLYGFGNMPDWSSFLYGFGNTPGWMPFSDADFQQLFDYMDSMMNDMMRSFFW